MNNEKLIWSILTETISFFSIDHSTPSSILPTDSITTYFGVPQLQELNDVPSSLFYQTLCVALDTINDQFHLHLRFDFELRQEWFLFETVGQLFMYFIYSIQQYERK